MANDLPKGKPVLSIDFDGVLHSYVSGWHGARTIPDPPVPGAMEWLASLLPDRERTKLPVQDYEFDVRIFSSRARHWGGVRAMKRWLLKHGLTRGEMKALRFARMKPPSFLHIDDRAVQFSGSFPTADEMLGFKPWRVQHEATTPQETTDLTGFYIVKSKRRYIYPDGSVSENKAIERTIVYIEDGRVEWMGGDETCSVDELLVNYSVIRKIVYPELTEP